MLLNGLAMKPSTMLIASLSLFLVTGCCGKKTADAASKDAPQSGSAAQPTAVAASEKKVAPSAPEAVTCTRFATLDMATPRRQPITTSVKGARMPAGGTEKVKRPELYSIQYWTTDTPKIEVACTIRKQLETDKWTIESMTGTSPVTLVARKGAAGVQVMVGPGDTEQVTAAFVTVAR